MGLGMGLGLELGLGFGFGLGLGLGFAVPHRLVHEPRHTATWLGLGVRGRNRG